MNSKKGGKKEEGLWKCKGWKEGSKEGGKWDLGKYIFATQTDMYRKK